MPEPTTYTGPLWVPGHPVPKGSMKCITPHVGGRRGVLVPESTVRDPDGFVGKLPDVLAWKARKHVPQPIDKAVELRVDFFIAQGKTTSFPQAPIGHGQGDLDKLVRQVGDAIGGHKGDGGLVTDDSRVARIVAEKHWANGEEGACVELVPYVPPMSYPGGNMPVRIQAGRDSYQVGAIRTARDLPRLLRAVADQIERTQR